MDHAQKVRGSVVRQRIDLRFGVSQEAADAAEVHLFDRLVRKDAAKPDGEPSIRATRMLSGLLSTISTARPP